MIQPLNKTYLDTLLCLNYDILVFENYGFDLDRKAVILITPFYAQKEANDFFDNSKRSYNLVKIRDFKSTEFLGKYHLSLFIDIPEVVISRLM